MLRFGGDGDEAQLREVDTVTTRAAWQETGSHPSWSTFLCYYYI
jgi:hypothetical protein